MKLSANGAQWNHSNGDVILLLKSSIFDTMLGKTSKLATTTMHL